MYNDYELLNLDVYGLFFHKKRNGTFHKKLKTSKPLLNEVKVAKIISKE